MNDDDSHENEKKDDSNQNQSSSIFSVANSFVQHKNGKAARQLSLGSQALKPKIMINNEDLDSFDEGLNSNQKILELSDEDEYQGDQDNESMSKVSFKSDHLRQYPAKLSSRKAGTPQIIVEGSQQDATKILNVSALNDISGNSIIVNEFENNPKFLMSNSSQSQFELNDEAKFLKPNIFENRRQSIQSYADEFDEEVKRINTQGNAIGQTDEN